MQFPSLAIALAATFQVALANFGDLSVPKTIAFGQSFDITGHYLLDKAGTPATVLIGVFPFNSKTQPNYVPNLDTAPIGIRGPNPVLTDLSRYNVTIPYTLPKLFDSDSFYLQWFQLSYVGVENYMTGESYLFGPLNVGASASSELVTVQRSGPGYTAFQLKKRS